MKLSLILLLTISLAGCAEVPTQSVQLSTALGQDLAQTRRAHLKLVELYYARVEADANRFVDDVYAPHQLNATWKQSPHSATATGRPASPVGVDQNRQADLDSLKAYLIVVRNNIEEFRKKNLAPIREQQKLLTTRITESYDHMLRANIAVTAYLSSLVKLKHEQDKTLKNIVPAAWQAETSRSLADVSEKIDTLHQDAHKEIASGRNDVSHIVRQFEMLMQLNTAH
ncbi:hypothetical protein F2P45_29640 [Massilia sp. CCM 8733]|uniref:ATPase n=1 Tax=Massilia mucilaginosa TaxID=2609282 RepID=A0ABX0P1N0_9BURK|nr:hypothetical protein [Massilia mucilaginosa]NHZ93142.1 hypothetical protein [Massilia mucilaginosa]